MESSIDLNAHAKPPTAIREVYKAYQKLDKAALETQSDLLDLTVESSIDDVRLKRSTSFQLPPDHHQIFAEFSGTDKMNDGPTQPHTNPPSVAFESTALPGLFVYPSILPPEIQLHILDKLLHRDLSNAEHKTNVHMHYHVKYPETPHDGHLGSFFDGTSGGLTFEPQDPGVHTPITQEQFLNRKLRWITLGGQYDWTAKVYPSTRPPPFPADTQQLLERLFPMKAEAAIVNLYSPGDTLSLHRDVSEECGAPLVSISLGCDGIFVVGLDEARTVVMRLRSGDAVLMSGESRYAWHGVPKVLEGTCPEWMENWPARGGDDGRYDQWKGWMKGKRVNLNVRQMFA